MKISKNILKLLTLALAIGFTSCNNDDDPLGSGEGKLGFAFVLNNGTQSSQNGRVANSNLTIESGFIQIKELELEVEGRRESGNFSKEIEIKFNDIRKISFNEFDESTDFIINIEAGEYREIEIELDLIDYRNEPSIFIEGTYSFADGSTAPLIYEYFGDDIDFEVEIESEGQFFTIDARNNPLALFEINANNWFRGISDADFESAELVNGTLLINRNTNRNIYNRVSDNIEEFADIEIELKN
ncbi:hypothetical protein MM236_08445 [Belliella sp. DSM 107340]|uniref:DUF4382 domain-containing protein n=1 Tax=Belliella calami TaxID=2923436 RepID=A0ABS9UN36_9BACT|nr:hypothetical protein [Belliella calami]MCH7398016.1 hypothetical protein [Belliella calami]